MRRGTTPTITVSVSGLDLSSLATIYLTLKQILDDDSEIIITKYGDMLDIDYDKETVSYRLTQEETLRFEPGKSIQVQIRAIDDYETAFASPIKLITVDDVLLNEVIKRI